MGKNQVEAEPMINTIDADSSARIALEGRIHHNSPQNDVKKEGRVQLEFQNTSTSITEESFEKYLQQYFTLEINPEDVVEKIHEDIEEVIDVDPSVDLFVQVQYKNPHSSKMVTKGQLV